MKRNHSLPELLAPAGDFDALVAAILGGADAIYVGGLKFGARAFAKNFSDEALADAVKLCHIFGVRLYVTLNTLVFDKEVNEALEYARRLYNMGVDALIIADLGMLSLIRKEIPELELHASTQMGAHNSEGVNFAASLGIKRVVLARECSGEDIKKIVAESNAECEVFVHGALCVCHSGQCLFSSMVGGRSGNRGECAQPCRLPYNGNKYPLSLSDLSLSEHITSLIESGVSSLKIEGRMKSADYVYRVTRIYRELLDAGRNSSASEKRELAEIFSRGGFTDGYYKGRIFDRMTGVRSDADKTASRSLSGLEFKPPRMKIAASASFKLGEPSRLTLEATILPRWENAGLGTEKKSVSLSVTAVGATPVTAESSPLNKADLEARLSKMGNTPFELSKDILIDLEEGINLPPSAINALRREACDKLSLLYARSLAEIMGNKESEAGAVDAAFTHTAVSTDSYGRYSVFYEPSVIKSISREDIARLGKIFVPLDSYETFGKTAYGVLMPAVIMENEWQSVIARLSAARESGAKAALVSNISEIKIARELGFEVIADFRLNTANSYTAALLKSLGAEDIILSPELTLPMARDIGGAVITLGRIPLMITERCFVKENFGCDKCGKAYFTDRKGAKFPLLRTPPHRNIIFNSAPTYMGDKRMELKSARIKRECFIFSVESAREVNELISAYDRGITIGGGRRVGKR